MRVPFRHMYTSYIIITYIHIYIYTYLAASMALSSSIFNSKGLILLSAFIALCSLRREGMKEIRNWQVWSWGNQKTQYSTKLKPWFLEERWEYCTSCGWLKSSTCGWLIYHYLQKWSTIRAPAHLGQFSVLCSQDRKGSSACLRDTSKTILRQRSLAINMKNYKGKYSN